VEPLATNHGSFKEGLQAVGNQLASPAMLNPAYEVLTNHDHWRNKPIALSTDFNQQTDPEIGRQNYNALSNAIAQKINVQPAVVAHLIRRYLPGPLAMYPAALNFLMEKGGFADEDVQPSNSPIAGQGYSLLPRVTPRVPWGFGNESVQDLMRYSSQAQRERNDLDKMPESRKAAYKAAHPLTDDTIYWKLKNTAYTVRTNEDVAKMILLNEHPDWKGLPEDVRKKDASDLRRVYTLEAIEVMRSVINQISGNE